MDFLKLDEGRVGHSESPLEDKEKLERCLEEWITEQAVRIVSMSALNERRKAIARFRKFRGRIEKKVLQLWNSNRAP